MKILYIYIIRGGFRGGAPGPGPPIFTCKIFLEPCICPYANTCLKISSSIDLKFLLYVCATVKIQFANTILNHTHRPLGCCASSRLRAPLFENSGSAPDYEIIYYYVDLRVNIGANIYGPTSQGPSSLEADFT